MTSSNAELHVCNASRGPVGAGPLNGVLISDPLYNQWPETQNQRPRKGAAMQPQGMHLIHIHRPHKGVDVQFEEPHTNTVALPVIATQVLASTATPTPVTGSTTATGSDADRGES